MAGRAYGNVMNAGRQTIASSTGSDPGRRGPSNKNLQPTRVSRPNPAPSLRSNVGRAGIKGPDKGAGSS